MSPLLPMAEYWWLYIAFTAFIVVMLGIDLALHRKNTEISIRNAAVFTAMWIMVALAFSLVVYRIGEAAAGAAAARDMALQFITGYVVEKALSVDNMFVFALVFRYFAAPSRYEHKVLFYGVLGAILLRAAFITTGSLLIRFEWVLIGFGVLLVYSGMRLAFGGEENVRPGDSWVIRAMRRFLPVTDEYDGSRFLTRVGGRLHATPLLVVLLVLESTDVMFAVDSVPAVLGVTREPFLAFSSNILAVLGLRSMYFVLSGALDRFHVLKHGLAVVLVFVGLKMVWLDRAFGGHFPIGVSLGIIVAVIGASVALSFAFPKGSKVDTEKIAKLGVGVLLLVLASAAGLCALDVGESLFPEFAAAAPNEALWVSAACYAVCGSLLVYSSTRRNSVR